LNLLATEKTLIAGYDREIGCIFQAFNLIGDLTVYENVELPLTYRTLSDFPTPGRCSGPC